ncbi:hypothetical protein ACFL1J_04510 [Pseudomonadota bacterium]
MKRRAFLKKLVIVSTAAGTATMTGTVLARLGRPASPNSVAGVRRRRRRRRRRRIRRHMRLYSLPYGCTVTIYRGDVLFYYCAGIWYRPIYQGTTVVYIVEEIEAGAETNVEFEE